MSKVMYIKMCVRTYDFCKLWFTQVYEETVEVSITIAKKVLLTILTTRKLITWEMTCVCESSGYVWLINSKRLKNYWIISANKTPFFTIQKRKIKILIDFWYIYYIVIY